MANKADKKKSVKKVDKNEVKVVLEKALEPKKDKKMSKNMLTTIIIAVVSILFIVLSFLISAKKDPEKEIVLQEMDVSKASKTIQDWYNDLASGETVVSVLASSKCPHCQELKPIITKVAEDYKLKLYFVEADQMDSVDYEIYTKAIELVGYNGSVPYMFIVSDKKFVNSHTGSMSQEDLVDYLKDNNVIEN